MELSGWWPRKSMSFYMWLVEQISLKTEQSSHSGLILTWWGTGGGNDRHWLLVTFIMVELKFHLLVVGNINPMEEVNKKSKQWLTKKKACYSWCFSSNTVNPSVHTIYKKKKKAFLQCLSSVSDNLNCVEVDLLASQRICEKCNFPWIPKQGRRVEIYSTAYQEMTCDFSSWV